MRHFLQLGIDLDFCDHLGLTALHHAALSGYEDVVQDLIDKGADVNAQSLHFGTPLHLACLKSRTLLVNLLLNSRANVRAQSRLVGTPLHCAAQTAPIAIIEALRKRGADYSVESLVSTDAMEQIESQASVWGAGVDEALNATTSTVFWISDCSPLDLAYQKRPEEVIKALLQDDFPTEAKSRTWSVPNLSDIGLHCAHEDSLTTDLRPTMLAARRDNIGVLRFLNNYEVDVYGEDSDGWTVLHHAAYCDSGEAIDMLIRMGAFSDRKDRRGYTPLMMASEEGNFSALRALLRNYADLTACCYEKHTALHVAANEGCVRLLVQAGASLTFTDREGMCPAFHYIDTGRTSLLRTLIEIDCTQTVAHTGPSGDSLVHFAAQQDDRIESLNLLIARKAPLTGWNLYEFTPLGMAVRCQALACIKALIAAGCAVDEYMGHGHSLLSLACISGNRGIARLLLERGAPPNSYKAADGSVPPAVYEADMQTLIQQHGGVVPEAHSQTHSSHDEGPDEDSKVRTTASEGTTQQDDVPTPDVNAAPEPEPPSTTEAAPNYTPSQATASASSAEGSTSLPEQRPSAGHRNERSSRRSRPRPRPAPGSASHTNDNKPSKSSGWAAFFAGGRLR